MVVRSDAKDKRFKMATAFLLIIIMLALVGFAFWSYVNAFFIALFSFIFLDPLYKRLRTAKLGKTTSALTAMAVGVILVGIPALVLSGMLVQETAALINQTNITKDVSLVSTGLMQANAQLANTQIGTMLTSEAVKLVEGAVGFFQTLILSSLQNIGHMALEMLVILFVLYYLLVGEEKLEKFGSEMIPFNRKNTAKLIAEFKNILYSVLICTGFIAFIQVVPMVLVFTYYGIPEAIFWGVVGFILACIPFVGIPFIWIPVALAELLQGNQEAALGITLVGIGIAIIENFRPLVQKNIGQIHPLISVLGVIIGITYFGVLGVLVGPILLSFVLLTIRMFREEYL